MRDIIKKVARFILDRGDGDYLPWFALLPVWALLILLGGAYLLSNIIYGW